MSNVSQPPFHLAFPVTDLEAARAFYIGVLECGLGREDSRWIDFNFFGHQISAHLAEQVSAEVPSNQVDGRAIPVRHFGAILEWQAWERLADRLSALGIEFLVEPHIRFAGQVGEQATLFIQDPAGNGLEFKAFKNPQQLFRR